MLLSNIQQLSISCISCSILVQLPINSFHCFYLMKTILHTEKPLNEKWFDFGFVSFKAVQWTNKAVDTGATASHAIFKLKHCKTEHFFGIENWLEKCCNKCRQHFVCGPCNTIKSFKFNRKTYRLQLAVHDFQLIDRMHIYISVYKCNERMRKKKTSAKIISDVENVAVLERTRVWMCFVVAHEHCGIFDLAYGQTFISFLVRRQPAFSYLRASFFFPCRQMLITATKFTPKQFHPLKSIEKLLETDGDTQYAKHLLATRKLIWERYTTHTNNMEPVQVFSNWINKTTWIARFEAGTISFWNASLTIFRFVFFCFWFETCLYSFLRHTHFAQSNEIEFTLIRFHSRLSFISNSKSDVRSKFKVKNKIQFLTFFPPFYFANIV